MGKETFSLYKVMASGLTDCYAANRSASEIAEKAGFLVASPGAGIGTTQKIFITDSSNRVRWEWTFRKGITKRIQMVSHY
jgi:hypothetical protein